MSFLPRRSLGALLAVTVATPSVTALSETPLPPPPPPPPPPSPSPTPVDPLRPAAIAAKPASPATSVVSAAEALRARALLDRYYALSADAIASNQPAPPPNAATSLPPQPPPAKEVRVTPSRQRTPARDALQVVEHKSTNKRFVICGGGTAAWAAIDAILKEDPTAADDVLIITEESHLPYNRTVLSKELWQPSHAEAIATDDGLRSEVEYAYKHVTAGDKVAVMCEARAVRLDVDKKSVELAGGAIVHYEKLLLATGGKPKSPAYVSPALIEPSIAPSVSVFRTLEDFKHLHDVVSQPAAAVNDGAGGVVVVGGGFSGTELAIALSASTKSVALVMAEAGVLYRVLPRYLCEYLARKVDEAGVKVLRSAVVTGATREKGACDAEGEGEGNVTLEVDSPDGERVSGREIVVSIGIEPEVALARDAGLEIDGVNGGVMANDFMMAEPDVYVAGDMASFHDRNLGRRRVEHWDHAVVSGRIAGQNMVGRKARYGLQSMFWCDLGNIGVDITAVGRVDSKLETVAALNTAMPCVEEVPSSNELTSGVVYYVESGEVVGVVLWNAKKGMGALRRARAVVEARTNVDGLSDNMLGDLVNVDNGSFRMYVRTKAAVQP